MKRVFFVSIALSTLAGCTDDGTGGSGLKPFRDEWRAEYPALAFPYAGEVPGITRIDIGGLLYNDNFENRGDVIVNFTGPEEQITIEIRRFTMAASIDDAADQFGALTLWAYNTSGGSPSKPSDMMEENNCLGAGWLDQCTLRVYYDGLTQLSRLGADLRVTLPASYRHELNIVTNDADDDDDYINRGNVCIENLDGTAAVTMHSGIGLVTLAEGVNPSPHCPQADYDACVAAAWDNAMCECDTFGRLELKTDTSGTADLTVDMPQGLWSYINAENTGQMQDVAKEHCVANIDPLLGADYTMPLDPAKPWQAKAAETNDPGDLATEGAGYSLTVTSAECGAAARTENPEDFVGTDLGEMQENNERGNVLVCNNCLRGRGMCDRLDDLAQAGGAPPPL